MAERTKLLYIIVHDEESNGGEVTKETLTSSFRYTRPVLQSTLQLFGCKQRHGFKISKRVFSLLENNYRTTSSGKKQDQSSCISGSYSQGINVSHFETNKVLEGSMISMDGELKEGLFGNTYSSTIVLGRDVFLDLVSDALSEYRYMGPSQRADLLLACRVRERKTSMTVLLCGTSGCGKSTLSSLLASRLGITTVVSTDSIRHMMRSFVDEKENPLLWASTYHAGEFLDPAAVAEAKARKIKKRMEGFPARIVVDDCSKFSQGIPLVDALSKDFNLREVGGGGILLNETNSEELETFIKPKTMVVQGYKAQSEMVIDSLDRLITAWEQKCESVVVEGVHLSINFVMGLMKKHPSVIPFMIYIVNEEKHLERFAVRAKYMTLDPAKNKYVKYIRNIRTIQDYLCARADKYLVPKVNNTNVDRSIASIHATIFGCLRRRGRGEPFYDQTTNTVKVIDEEYRSQCVANSLGSKGMLQLIKRRGYSRQLLALVNTDGSVAQAWSFDSGGNVQASTMSGNIHSINSSVFEHLVVEKSEPVNLQFGNFGLSAWEPDLGGTSHNGSIDGLSTKGGLSENDGSRFDSSCSSTPRHVDGAEKELINENALSGSDEEPEEVPDAETDDDFDFDFKSKPFEEHELEGSVDDQSLRSDEDDDDEFVAVDEQDEYCSMDLEGGIELGGEISGRTQESQARLLVNTTRSKSVDSNGDLQKEDDQLSAYAVHEKQVKFLKVNSLVQLV